MKLRFGTGIGRHETMLDIGKYAKVAEDCGFEHFAVLDDLTLTRDVYCMLAVAAQATSKIQVGTGVTHPFTRHPTQTAAAIASIDELSGGRAFLGLGAGSLYELIGRSGATARDLREMIDIVRGLLQGDEVDLQNGAKARSPWMSTSIPICLAAEGPMVMQLAGERADAIWTSGVTDEMIRWRLDQIARGAEREGRDPAEVDIWLRIQVVLADSKEEGRNIARSYVATQAHAFILGVLSRDNRYAREAKSILPDTLLDDLARVGDAWDVYQHEEYDADHSAAVTDELVDAYAIVGTPQECADQLSELGAKWGLAGISMGPFGHRDKLQLWREFADEVMPLVD